MRSFCKSAILFNGCLSSFCSFGAVNNGSLLESLGHEGIIRQLNGEWEVKQEHFAVAKERLCYYLRERIIPSNQQLFMTKTMHKMRKCLNCFFRYNGDIYGIRFYKNGTIHVGHFKKKLLNSFNFIDGDCYKNGVWTYIRHNDVVSIIDRVKATPQKIKNIGKKVIAKCRAVKDDVNTIIAIHNFLRESFKIIEEEKQKPENAKKIQQIRNQIEAMTKSNNISDMFGDVLEVIRELTDHRNREEMIGIIDDLQKLTGNKNVTEAISATHKATKSMLKIKRGLCCCR